MSQRHRSGQNRHILRGRRSISSSGLCCVVERGKIGRTLGRGKRSYGKINLMVDTTEYLPPKDKLDNDADSLACSKLIHDLKDLSQSQKGCIVWITLEYFEISNKVVPYVDTLLGICLTNEYMMDVTTKNFLLITNMVRFGESIKKNMFNSLKHIHEDLLSFAQTHESAEYPPCLLKYYDYDIVCSYYKFVGLLFFRFRKHLDTYGRYSILAEPVLSGFYYLLEEGSLGSLKLLTRLVQLNFHALGRWYCDEIIQLDTKIQSKRKQFGKDDEKWRWLTGTLDIIHVGPILPRSLYDRYVKLLGEEWTENVVYPPVQVLEKVNEYVIKEKLHHFHIDDYDIFRNMFVYLP